MKGAVDSDVGCSAAELAAAFSAFSGAAFSGALLAGAALAGAVSAAAVFVGAVSVEAGALGAAFAGVVVVAVAFSEAAVDVVDVPEARFDVLGSAGAFFAGMDFFSAGVGFEAEDVEAAVFGADDLALEDFVVDDFEEDAPSVPVERVRVGFAGVGASAASVELSAGFAAPRAPADLVDAPRLRR